LNFKAITIFEVAGTGCGRDYDWTRAAAAGLLPLLSARMEQTPPKLLSGGC